MTEWNRIHAFVNVSKRYIIENYAMVKGKNGEILPVPCNCVDCYHCLFDNTRDCRKQTAEFLESEVSTNDN